MKGKTDSRDSIPQPAASENKAASSAEQVERLFRLVQDTLTLVLGFAAFLTAGGFVVVHSYLSQFTDIHGYNVASGQYLTAGAGLLLPIAAGLILDWGGYLLFRNSFINFLVTYVRNRNTSRRVLLTGILTAELLWFIVVGSLYGQGVYGSIPHYLGGGKPESMILVFKSPDTLSALGLTPNETEPDRTKTVLLLAELTDGLLVADTNTGRVVALKEESLLGTLDDRVTSLVITPTPPPASTPETPNS